jgi:hypothetical protein
VTDLRLGEPEGQAGHDDGYDSGRCDDTEQDRRTRPPSETSSARDAKHSLGRRWQGFHLCSQLKRRCRHIGAAECLAKFPIEGIRFARGSAHREATFPLT